jgi:hypothetical protein
VAEPKPARAAVNKKSRPATVDFHARPSSSSIRLIRKIRFIRSKLPSRWPEEGSAKFHDVTFILTFPAATRINGGEIRMFPKTDRTITHWFGRPRTSLLQVAREGWQFPFSTPWRTCVW